MDVITLSSIIGSSFSIIFLGLYMLKIEKDIEEQEDGRMLN
ncbi:hypothetical protein [Nitrosopumilus sp.]|nr:hypothetical protein [Nitrosopumilus sp.]